MTISSIRLLEGIGQALQTVSTKTDDALAKALIHAASIAVDELRRRDNPDTLRTNYESGRQLLGALIDKAGSADQRKAFAALPATIEASLSWACARQQMDALLGLAEQVGLTQPPGVTATDTSAMVDKVFTWADPASGTTMRTMYLQGGYGGIGIVPGVFEFTAAPGLGAAMVVAWRGDNAGKGEHVLRTYSPRPPAGRGGCRKG